MKERLLRFVLGLLIALVLNAIIYVAFSIGNVSFDITTWGEDSTGMFGWLFAVISLFSVCLTQLKIE